VVRDTKVTFYRYKIPTLRLLSVIRTLSTDCNDEVEILCNDNNGAENNGGASFCEWGSQWWPRHLGDVALEK